jgi:PleD family two-component response regulator
LNNLIHILSGTVSQLENIWEGTSTSEKYFEMLRVSVERAAKVTAELMKYAGGADEKTLLHPALAPSPPHAPAPPPALPQKRCILVVDDEPMALALARMVLSEAGFDVVTAQSGFEALDLFQKDPSRFALVLLDHRLHRKTSP